MGMPSHPWFHVSTRSGQILIAAIGGTIAGAVLLFMPNARSWCADRWHWCTTKIESAWNWTGATHEIYGWAILIGGIAIFWVVGLGMLALLRMCGEKQRHWFEYVQDEFNGITWRWRYAGEGIEEGSIVPFCKACDLQMTFSNSRAWEGNPHVTLHCGNNCQADQQLAGHFYEVQQAIKLQVQRKIRNGEWVCNHPLIRTSN